MRARADRKLFAEVNAAAKSAAKKGNPTMAQKLKDEKALNRELRAQIKELTNKKKQPS